MKDLETSEIFFLISFHFFELLTLNCPRFDILFCFPWFGPKPPSLYLVSFSILIRMTNGCFCFGVQKQACLNYNLKKKTITL